MSLCWLFRLDAGTPSACCQGEQEVRGDFHPLQQPLTRTYRHRDCHTPAPLLLIRKLNLEEWSAQGGIKPKLPSSGVYSVSQHSAFSSSQTCSPPYKVAREHFVINSFLINPCIRVCFWGTQSKIHTVLAQCNKDQDQYPTKSWVTSQVPLVTALVPESLIQPGSDLSHVSEGWRKSVDSKNSTLGNLDAHILRL